ncbi:MAG TPA: sigma-54 dependent transcriptional regulator [Bacteroidota bacterium]|jgi:DNA-binding NtrC family response regulator|nr:sigma-54 dependent transcriptional regulator [Bacteroidota bacterium]
MNKYKILVIDDEQSIRESISMILEYENYLVELAANGVQGLNLFNEQNFDAVLLDVKMPGLDGIEVLQLLKERNKNIPIIMISGHGTIETAIECTKKGAYDFLEKPLDRDKLLISLRNAIEHSTIISEYQKIKDEVEEKFEILGESKVIKELKSIINVVAKSDSRVLITGENGTGKELIARQIYKNSNRADKPFVEVNCAAIPKELIESELFGHEKGAFTGATNQRIGKFEQANTGTIFLDEIGDMSLEAQAKVLRVLEQGTFERVGGSELIKVDVRVIAATNKNLEEEIKKGNFREDLFHRLNVIPIVSPPLREHIDDIPILVEHFVKEICNKYKIAEKKIGENLINFLKRKEWKGNVRELKNFIERLIILNPTKQIIDKDDNQVNSIAGESDFDFSKDYTLQEFQEITEKIFIKKQLEKYDWNVTKTAEALDIQRSHLYTKIKKYGLEKSGK